MVDNLMEKSQYRQLSLHCWFHIETSTGSPAQIPALPQEHALEEDSHGCILEHLLVHYQHQNGYPHFSFATNGSTWEQPGKQISIRLECKIHKTTARHT
jgi:hypothetical protein